MSHAHTASYDSLTSEDSLSALSGVPLTPSAHTFPPNSTYGQLENGLGEGHDHVQGLLSGSLYERGKSEMEPFNTKEVAFVSLSILAVLALASAAFSVTLFNIRL